MKKVHCLLIAWLLLFCQHGWSYCDAGVENVYYTAYATRSGAIAITYINASMSGADSEYSYATITQYDYLNGSQYATAFSVRSPNPGQSIFTQRTRNINLTAFGTYSVQGYVQLFDACSGKSWPPYDNGASPYTNVSIRTVDQPLVYLSTLSGIYVSNFNNASQYPTSLDYIATYGPGISGTPVWTFLGNTQNLDISCTYCITSTVSAQSTAITSCSVRLTASFVVDGLQSGKGYLVVQGPNQISGNDPNTKQHVNNNAVPRGYASLWFYQIVDNCGNPMGGVGMHEVFPTSFSYDYNGVTGRFLLGTPGQRDQLDYGRTPSGSPTRPHRQA